MNEESLIKNILSDANVAIDGTRPWDIQVHNHDFFSRIVAEGSVGLGEAYVDGWWDCEQLDEFFNRVVASDLGARLRMTPHLAWLIVKSKLFNRQSAHRAWISANVHYNYEVVIFAATFGR